MIWPSFQNVSVGVTRETWGHSALGNCPHGQLRLWATLCPQRPMSFVATAPSRSSVLFIFSQRGGTSCSSPLWCLCLCILCSFHLTPQILWLSPPQDCVAKTDYIWQVESFMEPFPWRRKKNSNQNWRLIFLIVDASSILFRKQKESIWLGREGKMWSMCMYLFFVALSQVATHLVFRTNCWPSYLPIPQVVLENN